MDRKLEKGWLCAQLLEKKIFFEKLRGFAKFFNGLRLKFWFVTFLMAKK